MDRDAPDRLGADPAPDGHRRPVPLRRSRQGPYGNGGVAQASGQITGAADSLWGKPVYVTSAIGGAGTALVGNSQAAQVWSRGGLNVEAT